MLLRLLYKLRWTIPILAMLIAMLTFVFSKWENKDKVAFGSLVVVTSSLMFTFIAIEGNERTFTYNICSDWYKSELNKSHVNIFYFTPKERINELIIRFNEGKLNPDDEEKFQKVVAILNYLETLSTFYYDNKLDRSIVKDNFKHILKGYYEKFYPLIHKAEMDLKNEPLRNFIKLRKELGD